MARKIFVGNYKGGVGKTTSVFEIGAILLDTYKKKILLIDLDPQCSLSKTCCSVANISQTGIKPNDTLNFAIELYNEYLITNVRE